MGMICNFSSLDLATLEKLKADPKLIDSYIWPLPKSYLDLHKYWHGIHFILADDEIGPGPEPISWAVLGGTYIGEDVGYGPARFLMPEQVKMVSESFDAINESQFRAKFDPKKFEVKEIYPTWEWDSKGLDFLVEYYHKLVDFYRAAASRGDGMLIWLN
ncbi:MAG: DUF1877 family protein [Alphaproteobacteria bacterium]|nr:MAG: DUF1877 family protein [Alphaproteobacteria bacterium]